MENSRFFVGYSKSAEAYAVFDRHEKRPENSTGCAILWGTDSPYKDKVIKECEKLNEEFNATGHVKHLGK